MSEPLSEFSSGLDFYFIEDSEPFENLRFAEESHRSDKGSTVRVEVFKIRSFISSSAIDVRVWRELLRVLVNAKVTDAT